MECEIIGSVLLIDEYWDEGEGKGDCIYIWLKGWNFLSCLAIE